MFNLLFNNFRLLLKIISNNSIIKEIPKKYTITATYKGYKVSNKITVKPTLICKNMAVKKEKQNKLKGDFL